MHRRLLLGLVLLAACRIQQRAPRSGPAPDEHIAHMSAADLAAANAPAGFTTFQGVPGLPASGSQAAARLAASPRHGEWVKFALEPGSTDTVMAWVVYPKTSGKAGAVVVVHENTGLITWVRNVADQVAADGFIAIAPDFLSRVRGGPSTVELARDSVGKILPGVTMPERQKIITAAANWVMTQPSSNQKYAVIGFCWGGSTTWGHAVHGGVKGFAGGVAFYGSPFAAGGRQATATEAAVPASPVADSLARIKVPVMLLNGSKDMRIGAMMPAIDSIMKAMGKSYGGTNYEGAVHGFMRAQDDPRAQNRDEAEEQANLAAAKDAWPKTIAFLKKQLGN